MILIKAHWIIRCVSVTFVCFINLVEHITACSYLCCYISNIFKLLYELMYSPGVKDFRNCGLRGDMAGKILFFGFLNNPVKLF